MFSIAHVRVRVNIGGIYGPQKKTGIGEPDVVCAYIGNARAGGSVHQVRHRRLRATPGKSGLAEVLSVSSAVPQLSAKLEGMVLLNPGQAGDGLELLIKAIRAWQGAEKLSGTAETARLQVGETAAIGKGDRADERGAA
jgi:hypothetical protein